MRQSQGWGGPGWEASAGGQEGAVFHVGGEPCLEAPLLPTASHACLWGSLLLSHCLVSDFEGDLVLLAPQHLRGDHPGLPGWVPNPVTGVLIT